MISDIQFDIDSTTLTWYNSLIDDYISMYVYDEYHRQKREAYTEARGYATDEHGNREPHYEGSYEDFEFDPVWESFINDL